VRLGVVSDLHLTLDPAIRATWHNPFDFAGLPARIDDARAVFDRAGVDAVVACGDVVHDGDEPSARAVLGRLSAGRDRPLLVVAGNHDCIERDDQLERCVTEPAAMLTATGVELDGLRLAGVPVERDGDRMRWTGAGEGGTGVVVSHYPVISREERLAEAELVYSGDLTNRSDLHERLEGAAAVIVLSGHIHARESHASGNVLQLSAGALVEAPYEVAVVDVRAAGAGVEVRRRVHVLGPPPAGPDPVLAPEQETWTFGAGGWRAA
jgi:predicted phosphodiesterase